MIVLISPEQDIDNEILILNQLFEAGLEYYHLRKPDKTIDAYRDYLLQIDEKHHNKIVIHFYHTLINEYNLKGIHFQEQFRRAKLDVPSDYFKGLNMYGKTISSSFHETQEVIDCSFEFDYHLLSPVFSSISSNSFCRETKAFCQTTTLLPLENGSK